MGVLEEGEALAWRLAALEGTCDDAIITIGPAGTIRGWNGGADRLYGYGAEEVIGQPLTLLAAVERRQEIEAMLATLRSGQQVRFHHTVRRARGGHRIDVLTHTGPVRTPSGEVIGAVIIDRDLTEQRSTAAMLDSTLARLQGNVARARDAEGLGRRFLADAAHQLRSPITGIRVCAEALLWGPEAPERDRLLTDLVSQTARATRLLSSLLRMARLDEGEEVHYRRTDVVGLVREEADRLWHLAPELDIVLRAEGLGEEGATIDPAALQEIVANLLENAVRHASAAITVHLFLKDQELEVQVRDDGPGLAHGQEERVFERFVSLDDRGGSGLGLPIARSLARVHGGDVTYEAGSFVVRLPVQPTPPVHGDETEAEASPGSGS